MSPMKKEEEYYEIIKEKLNDLFKKKGVNVYLEITARGMFSNKLKSKIPQGREVVFLFLKKVAPDITGFVEGSVLPGFVVVEVKGSKIELEDIYQLKKYSDLFEARFAFLISLKPVPEEIKRLEKAAYILTKLKGSIYQAFVLAQFNEHTSEFVEWFDKDPFSKSIYWK